MIKKEDALQRLAEFKSRWEEGMIELRSKPEWRINNLEWDIENSEYLSTKIRSSIKYAQSLYAALCNNEFQPIEPFEILKDTRWSCTWRYAGGIMARIRESGDYMDFYCSGIQNAETWAGEIPEGQVTDEIHEDLKRIGWYVLDNGENNEF